MERRKTRRYNRRIPVSFWTLDNPKPKKGFTLSVAETGVFIATNLPCSSGTLLTIELPLHERMIQLEGQVRSAFRVDPALRKWKQSGMGVRLLRTEEMMKGIIAPKANDDPRQAVDRSAPSSEGPEGPSDGEEAPVFSVYIDTPAELERVFEQHIKHGGVFVPNPGHTKIKEKIGVEFRLNWNPKTVIQTTGRVVGTFSENPDAESDEPVAGIGVAFSDPQETIAHFRQLLSGPDLPGAISGHP